MASRPSTAATAQQYIEQHKLHQALDALVLPIVKSRDPRPLELLAQNGGSYVAAGIPAPATALLSAGSVTPADLASLDFDAFAFYKQPPAGLVTAAASSTTATTSPGASLHGLVQKVFESHGLLSHFKIDAPTFLQWVATVEANYHAENPFHNFLHAFNVLQTANVFVTGLQRETTNAIAKLDIFCLFVAALCHDLQHPGLTNDYLSLTEHPLALRYNDKAVLENHHAATTLAMFFGPTAATSSSSGLLRNFSAEDKQYLRKTVASLILSTCLAECHSAIIGKLTAVLDQLGLGATDKAKKLITDAAPNAANVGGCSNSHLFLQAILKGADISNECRNYSFSQKWAPLVKEEFYQQGDKHKQLPATTNGSAAKVPQMQDRDDEKSAMMYDQPGFIDFLCVPLYNVLERISPSVFGVPAGNLKANATKWKSQQPGYVGSPVKASVSGVYGAASLNASSPSGAKSPMVPSSSEEDSDEEEEYDSSDEL